MTVTHRFARPKFFRRSMVALALVLPFLIHAVWSYIETRRFDTHIRAIEAKGEPTQIRSTTPTGDAARADRYYRAAAVLAEFRSETAGSDLVTAAQRTGEWSDALIARARQLLGAHQDTFAFVDQAADLPFEDFAAGTTYSYLAVGLTDAIRLTCLRAIVQTAEGNADAGARSLYAAARAGRWFARKHSTVGLYSVWFAPAVAVVLERGRPDEAALERLALALEDLDRDDILEQMLLTARASSLQSGAADSWFIGPRTTPVFVIERPWLTHRVNQQLAWYRQTLQAVDAPWPTRIDVLVDSQVGLFNLDVPFDRTSMIQRTTAMIAPLAVIRTMRAAVGIERYRRRHAEQLPALLGDIVPSMLSAAPVDPFSGEPVHYLRTGDGYNVYSVGENRVDDGGDVRFPTARGADVGMRFRQQK
jgi:hypothetical protein